MKKFWFSIDIIAIMVILIFSAINCNSKTPNKNEDDYPITDSQYVDTLLRDTASKIPEKDSSIKLSTGEILVPYHEGMSLAPGQSTAITEKFVITPDEDETEDPFVNLPITKYEQMGKDMLKIIKLNEQWIASKDRLYGKINDMMVSKDSVGVDSSWDKMDKSYKRFNRAMKQFKKQYKPYLK